MSSAPTQTKPRGRGRPPVEMDTEALLDAALKTFAEEGFRGGTVELVAERAGLTKPLLFRRFGSKEELFEWTIDREVGVLTERLFTVYDRAESAQLGEALHAGVEAIIGYATARPSGFSLLFGVGDVGSPPGTAVTERVHEAVTQRMEQVVHRRLERGSTGGGELSARVLAAAIVGASTDVARLCVEDSRIDPDAAGVLLAGMLARGLRGLRPGEVADANRPRRK